MQSHKNFYYIYFKLITYHILKLLIYNYSLLLAIYTFSKLRSLIKKFIQDLECIDMNGIYLHFLIAKYNIFESFVAAVYNTNNTHSKLI